MSHKTTEPVMIQVDQAEYLKMFKRIQHLEQVCINYEEIQNKFLMQAEHNMRETYHHLALVSRENRKELNELMEGLKTDEAL